MRDLNQSIRSRYIFFLSVHTSIWKMKPHSKKTYFYFYFDFKFIFIAYKCTIVRHTFKHIFRKVYIVNNQRRCHMYQTGIKKFLNHPTRKSYCPTQVGPSQARTWFVTKRSQTSPCVAYDLVAGRFPKVHNRVHQSTKPFRSNNLPIKTGLYSLSGVQEMTCRSFHTCLHFRGRLYQRHCPNWRHFI